MNDESDEAEFESPSMSYSLDGGQVLRHLAQFDVSEDDVREMRQHLIVAGCEATGMAAKYLLWKALILKVRERSSLQSIYRFMAVDCHLDGIDPMWALRESARCRLAEFKQKGFLRAKIVAGNGACEACAAQDGLVLTIDDALQTLPVPCMRCVHGIRQSEPFAWCRCMYMGSR